MTDDQEPRLRDHLRLRSSRPVPPPDPDDLHDRIDTRDRRRVRALAGLLAVVVVAGPMLGWSLARSTEDDRRSLAATIQRAIREDGGGSYALAEIGHGPLPDYLGPPLPLVGVRTTAEGLTLTVRAGQPEAAYEEAGGHPCRPDRLVRVGVTARELVGTATVDSRPQHAAFAVTGAPEGTPIWVVVVRSAAPEVTARFPNGTSDTAVTADGLAVLAAYGEEGRNPADHTLDTIDVDEGTSSRVVRAAVVGDPDCGDGDVPAAGMPDPGVPPADEQASRAQITSVFEQAFDGSRPNDPSLRQDPAIWLDAHLRFEEQLPEYEEWADNVRAEVLEIVFTAPDIAAVRFTFTSEDPGIQTPGERIGYAVRLGTGEEQRWRVSIETSCELLGLAGVRCNR